MKERTELDGIIEDTVGDSKLVDSGIKALQRYEKNAPSFDPERRRFLKYCAGVIGAGILSIGPVKKAEAFLDLFQKRDWKAHLLSQDLIRGPSLLYWNGRYIDFNEHASGAWNSGFGAVDYEVPLGTPIVPTAYGSIRSIHESHQGGKKLRLSHEDEFGDNTYRSSYVHLSQRIVKTKNLLVDLPKIIALSGNSGYINTELQPEHLHFQIYQVKNGKSIPPGFDPFKLGVDGGRPVYWDTKTEIVPLSEREEYLQKTLDTIEQRLKEAEIDNETKKQLLLRRKNPISYRDYLRVDVQQKKSTPESFRYLEWLKSEAYTSKQKFIAMLPFIYPGLADFYKKENPDVKL